MLYLSWALSREPLEVGVLFILDLRAEGSWKFVPKTAAREVEFESSSSILPSSKDCSYSEYCHEQLASAWQENISHLLEKGVRTAVKSALALGHGQKTSKRHSSSP
jgi:hypothetical protein